MRNLNYDELDETAQGEAISEVNERHPVSTRDANLSELVELYEYNKYGEIMQDI